MYRHLLVPVDGTPVSDLNVERAVALAAMMSSRVTFLHAAQDFAATEDGAVLHAIAPVRFADVAVGDSHALLAKARAAAGARGVACSSVVRICDHPAQVIVETANACGCDLIVMASKGAKGLAGWLQKTNTQQVLRRTSSALLVTRVEATEPLSAEERALGVIRDEHRSLAAVAVAMRDLAANQAPLDADALELLAGMVVYLRGFPRQVHHPKEEQHLHQRLRARSNAAQALLGTLEAQHLREYGLVEEAASAIASARAGAVSANLGALVSGLASAVLGHMELEERELFPLAQQCLRDEDWTAIADAFGGHEEAAFDALPREEFRAVFRRIANMLSGGPTALAPKVTP